MAEREQWFPDETDCAPEQRITSCRRMPSETEEGSLRPLCWADYAGQMKTKANLQIFIAAARKREEALDHVLLYGPPGLGKTTLAGIVAAELGVELRVTTGPAIEKPGDLAAILTNLKPRSVLFIDEIHRLSRSVEEVLYPAMEDRVLDILIGKGPSAQSVRLDLAPFTLIGATTRAGSLSAPLRDRFGMIHRLELYQPEELAEILVRDARILGITLRDEAVHCLASRSRGTPRISIRLLKRLRDFAQVRGEEVISLETAEFALQSLGVDNMGLDETDRNILDKMMTYYQGGPVGLETLAAITGEDKATIEDMYEPYLMQIGFLTKTPRGRLLTPRAYQHLHRDLPAGWMDASTQLKSGGSHEPMPLEHWAKNEGEDGDPL